MKKKLEFRGTQGRWFACCKKYTPHFLFANEGETTICGFHQSQDDGINLPIEEVQANARLIESSKDLLDICIDFVEKVERGEAKSVRTYNRMKEVIAKVLGE